MKLRQLREILQNAATIAFRLPDGSQVPGHFHVTEIGKVTRHFIDCGGTERKEEVVNFQLWNANDYDHRLHPDKLLRIITLAAKTLGLDDEEIEVEYQGQTIQKFGLDFDGERFLLTATYTDCLAKEACGIPKQKKKIRLSELCSDSCCSQDIRK
ncbi:DUF6428 family protein [Sinomicrobium oceani]|uniref:DUF6428 family protein n=1 Tax=Sinomicrobium oceani TaxID=1150368 RepID=UPI00227B71C1|nr:DUF6428 family protein [Sinomicrobium oceani]